MKKAYRKQPGKVRAEIVASIILSVGIVTALLIPAPGPLQANTAESTLFTVTESDYSSPLLSSARGVRILNIAAGEAAKFAGYDDFGTRVDISNKVNIANITRYSGDLLQLLNVRFITGDTSNLWTLPIYISEAFWNRTFARNEQVIGLQVKIHELTYTIAGITRDFRGMLAGTDIWLPVGDTKPLAGINSMKIVGTLNSSTTWTRAQNTLRNCFLQFLRDQAYSERGGAKLVPLQKSLEVTEPPQIFASGVTLPPFATGS